MGEELLDAAYRGNVEEVKALLTKGVDVNYQSRIDGPTALSNAISGLEGVREEKLKVMRLLLEHGADANKFCYSGSGIHSPIMSTFDIEKIKLLVEYGADVNLSEEDRGTPLMYHCHGALSFVEASQGTDLAIERMKILLEAGADPTLKNKDGETVLNRVQRWRNRGTNDWHNAAEKAEALLKKYNKRSKWWSKWWS